MRKSKKNGWKQEGFNGAYEKKMNSCWQRPPGLKKKNQFGASIYKTKNETRLL